MIYFSRYNVEHRKYYICKIHLREYMIPGTIPLDSHFFLKKTNALYKFDQFRSKKIKPSTSMKVWSEKWGTEMHRAGCIQLF